MPPRFNKSDRAVLRAFADQEPAESKRLSSDGKRLDGNWMGGREIAYWKNDKLHWGEGRPHGRVDQSVIRALRQLVPRGQRADD